MKRIILLFLIAFPTFVLAQQGISVKSFDVIPNDMDARVNFPKRDQNGEVCAIIKVVTTQTGFDWEPDGLGITAAERKVGEYWLYVPRGAKRLTIKHDKLGILRNYQYPMAIQAATVYVMELVTGTVEVVVKEAQIETQWLVINSTPEGANVFINDNQMGATPFSRKFPEGEYTYRLELPMYHPEAGKVTLSGDRKTLDLNLRPRFGNISVSSTPESGMQIYLDDISTGKTTPATLTDVASGTHTVKLMNQWYQTQAQRVTVNDNQTTTATFAMEPAFSTITVTTEPPAAILIDGTQRGQGTLSQRMLPGVYTVRAELDKHRPDQRQITVTTNSPQEVSLRPQPMLGTLDVMSTPFDAKIKLNGKDHGTTPTTLRNLLVGTYTLTLEKAGYGTVTRTVEITDGRTTEVNETLPTGLEVTIASTPTGAQLWIDGTAAGSTPVTTTLSFGSHSLRLVNGKKEVTDQINVAQGGKARWEYDVSEFGNFTQRVAGITIDMVAVKGGNFTMGCTSEQGSDCYKDETPPHPVTVGDFYMGKYEVTQAQWKAVMGSNPSRFSGCDQCPVENVSWNDAQEFIRKLNELTGKTYRLPTEAEWEYAARGGAQRKGYKYSGSNSIGDVAWYYGNSGSETHPVGQKNPNELGLYDMSGNVWEWCSDWYGDYSSQAQTNPQGPSSGSGRVLRGGSWGINARYCRVSSRDNYSPAYRSLDGGFRVVLSP